MNRTKIDYLTLTFAPTLLRHITKLARIGAALRSPLFGVDWRLPPRELAAMIQPMLTPEDALVTPDNAEQYGYTLVDYVTDPNLSPEENAATPRAPTFGRSYADLVNSVGLHFLDSLCQAEIEFFLLCLNERLSLPSHKANRWGMTAKRGGMFGYKHSGTLTCDGLPAGVVAWGAANHGCLISFSGVGCAALDFKKLHALCAPLGKRLNDHSLSNDPSAHTFGAKITRLDIALDDYQGAAFSPHSMREAALDGAFIGNGKPPKFRWVESGSMMLATDAKAVGRRAVLEANDGCTFYVGSRQSGKLFRTYEKGKQVKSVEYPNWMRAEIELHSKDRVIPFDALLNPDVYFAGAYPICADLLPDVSAVPVKTFKAELEICIDVAIENGRRQISKLVNMMVNVLGMDPSAIVDTFIRGLTLDDVPERIKRPAPQDIYDFIHAPPNCEDMLCPV